MNITWWHRLSAPTSRAEGRDADQNGGSVRVLPGHQPSLSVTPSIGAADVRHRLGPA
jgi:hypothetical protein